MKPCIYARKSSESDERQSRSIESQIRVLHELPTAKDHRIKIFRESHSAKAVGERPVFWSMLEAISDGRLDTIFTWSVDRLSRNAGDLGRIVELMDAGMLREIHTSQQTFRNTPADKFLLMILGSQAKLENDNRREHVMRGQRAGAARGYRPCPPPIGYIRRPEPSVPPALDPLRAPVVKLLFELVGEYGMSGRMAVRYVNRDATFLTKKKGKLHLSTAMRTLHNPFYTGVYEYPEGSDNWHKGAHEPLVSEELFLKVQKRSSKYPKSRWGFKQYLFSRMIRCGSCGSTLAGDEKLKKLPTGIGRYRYYRCNRFKDRFCNQKAIREEQFIERFLLALTDMHIEDLDVKERLTEERERLRRFAGSFEKLSPAQREKILSLDERTYLRYILESDTYTEKRKMILPLQGRIFLKDRQVEIKPK